MSIAVTNVNTTVRQITRRDNTSNFTAAAFNQLLLEACQDISKRLLCLKTNTTGTLSSDGTTISTPSDMVDSDSAIDEFYLDSHLMDVITFAEWRAGNIDGYCYYNGTIYVNPTSDNDRSYTLYYSQLHGALSTNLEFDDVLKKAVEWLTIAKTYEYFEQFDKADMALTRYEREIRLKAPVNMVISRPRQTRE